MMDYTSRTISLDGLLVVDSDLVLTYARLLSIDVCSEQLDVISQL